ncbi:MAG: hypothetical protein P8N40_04575 [Gammaproteobacteria bacterium]|nr:hypothetical protein [Gammaproteobacteria bacterium]
MEMLARLENTTLSIWLRESGIAFFTSLTLHSIAMAFVIGVNFAIAFRLVRIVPEFELKPFLKFYNLYWLSVVVIFLSGCALLLAYPAKALTNPIFYIKFSLLTIGLIISRWLQNQMQIIKNNEFSRDKYFWVAMISVFIWIGTITTGRFLAYTNSVLLASRFF